MTESQLQAKIMRQLERLGAECVNVVVAGKSGTSDIIACLNGRFLAVEVKLGNKKPDPLQDAFLKRIRKKGGIGLYINEVNYNEKIKELS